MQRKEIEFKKKKLPGAKFSSYWGPHTLRATAKLAWNIEAGSAPPSSINYRWRFNDRTSTSGGNKQAQAGAGGVFHVAAVDTTATSGPMFMTRRTPSQTGDDSGSSEMREKETRNAKEGECGRGLGSTYGQNSFHLWFPNNGWEDLSIPNSDSSKFFSIPLIPCGFDWKMLSFYTAILPFSVF